MEFSKITIIYLILTFYVSLSYLFPKDKNITIEKTRIAYLYDQGNFEKVISELNYIAKTSKEDCFVSWLNVSLLEFERGNKKISEYALNKASESQFKCTVRLRHYLIESCKDVIYNKNLTDSTLSTKLTQSKDSLEKFLYWQLLYYKLRNLTNENLDHAKFDYDFFKNVPQESYRYANVLFIKSLIELRNENLQSMLQSLIESNTILEKLNYFGSAYLRNIYYIFYYTPPATLMPNSDLIIKYEKNPLVLKSTENRLAIYYYKTKYYYDNGDLDLSFYFANEAYKIAKNNPDILLSLAFNKLKTENYKTSLIFYNKLQSFSRYRVDAYLGAGICAYKLNDTKLCRYYTKKIIKSINFTSKEKHIEILKFLLSTNQNQLFLNIQKNFLTTYKNTALKSLKISYFFNETGNLLWERGQYHESLDQYQLAILSLLPQKNNINKYDDLDYSECISLSNLILYLNNKGEAFYQLSKTRKNKNEQIRDLKHCFKNLNLSIEQMYKYKMQLSSEEQMYLFSDLKSSKYPNIIKVCLELFTLTGDTYYHSQAFKYAEQGKATVMLSMLRGKNGSKIGLIPSEYKKMEDSINLQISLLNQRLSVIKEESPSKFAINSQIDVLANKRADLEKMYQEKYPTYYNLKYSSNVTQANFIQQSLSDKECIVEFLLSRNFLISYYLDKKNLIIKTDTLKNIVLADLADEFYNQVNHYNSDNYKPDSIKEFVRRASTLYNILLKPFETNFKGKTIIIVADNSLNRIPFEVLLTTLPDKTNSYRNLPYLIRKNAVYYAPSVTFLNELRQRPVLQKRARLLAVAPIYPSLKLNDTITRTLLAVRADTSIFGSLPNARNEIMFANRIAGGKLLAEKDATEGRFKKIAGEYDIIHLATHGILNIKASLQSNLLFADSNTGEDGFLHAYEIYNLNQTSQLVILSACNTGAGKNYGGEGVISVGRGFLSSGSRSVIMTLWPVNDHSSYELIKGFYKELKNETSVNDALRNSKLIYLNQADNLHSHPFFWTGYVIYGDASIKLSIQNNSMLYLLLTLIGIVSLVLLYWKFSAVASATRKLWPYKRNDY